jgi:hypothetical protein
MNTQLILFPQEYTGYSFSVNSVTNNYVTNTSFTSNLLNQGSAYNINMTPYMTWQTLVTDGTTIPSYGTGGWVGFYNQYSNPFYTGTTPPAVAGGNLFLYGSVNIGSANGSICGIAQEINNLTIGTSYSLVISYLPTNAGEWIIGGFGANTTDYIGNGGGTTPSTSVPLLAGTTTLTFTATATTMPLVISYESLVNNIVTISDIVIQETSPITIFEDYNDGQVLCDLYEEENIPLTLSVDDFTNIAEKTQSYSKSFDVPATDRNNRIFTHIFDITKTIETAYDFNPYVQTRAILKNDGVVVFEGSLRLLEIVDKEGEISYNVNLYSSSVALKEILENLTFGDLTSTFSELKHTYDYNNIDASWEGELELDTALASDSFALGSFNSSPALPNNKTNVLKYPFIDWTGAIDCTGTEPLLNALEDAFRPCISLIYIIRNIFRNAGFEYQSEFLDGDFFAKLYMDFNWGAGNAPNDWRSVGALMFNASGSYPTLGTSFANLVFDDVSMAPEAGWDDSTYEFTCQQNNTSYFMGSQTGIFKNTHSSAVTIDLEWQLNGTAVPSTQETVAIASNSYHLYSLNVVNFGTLSAGDVLKCVGKSTVAGVVQQLSPNNSALVLFPFACYMVVQNNDAMVRGKLVNMLRAELKQWDFIKSIMTMFNLITMPDPNIPNRIIIEPYNNVFGTNAKVVRKTLDWTYKLDVKDIKIKPLELKKKLVFKYSEDDDDYAFKVYKDSAGGSFLYGSMTLDGTSGVGSQQTNLTGIEDIEVKEFSATICKPIQDLFPDFLIPVVYAGKDDGTFEGFDNKPRILYWNYLNNTNVSYDIPSQNGVAGGIKTEYGQMSHVSNIPSVASDDDLNFGACQLFIGTPPINNLYANYYQQYYDELYNVNTRVLKAKVNLTPADINQFKFYDIVILKNRAYRVNKIDYKPNELSVVEFILISGIV